jgi:hypothetical protein
MNRESLEKARELILEALEKEKNLEEVDKTELMMNLYLLLDYKNYTGDMALLMQHSRSRR